MRHSNLEISLALCLASPVLGGGCGDGGTQTIGSGGATDPVVTEDSGTGGGTETDASASGDDTGDPTVGEEPPEIECGDGVHVGPLLLSPDNPGAVPVETLEGIAIIDGDLLIDSTNYVNLDFLHCIVEVRGDVQIYGNHFLEDLSGTDGITKIGRLPALSPTPSQPDYVDMGKGTVTISNNPVLTEINGFDGITQIGERDDTQPAKMQESPQSLVIRGNDTLATITGFGDLELIFESLIIQENPMLGDLEGLSALRGVGGVFSVTRNPSLCLSHVDAVGEALVLLGDEEHSTTSQNDPSC